jgi:hypothetical protein
MNTTYYYKSEDVARNAASDWAKSLGLVVKSAATADTAIVWKRLPDGREVKLPLHGINDRAYGMGYGR